MPSPKSRKELELDRAAAQQRLASIQEDIPKKKLALDKARYQKDKCERKVSNLETLIRRRDKAENQYNFLEAECELDEARGAFERAKKQYDAAIDSRDEAAAEFTRIEKMIVKLLEWEKFQQRHQEKRRRREKREEREYHTPPSQSPSPTRPVPTSKPNTAIAVKKWRTQTEAAFADYSKMTVFPYPPALGCTSKSCHGQKESRALPVCDCSIRAALRKTVNLNLKLERVKWHPDRFSKCPEQVREEFQAMAKEVFQMVDRMYEASK